MKGSPFERFTDADYAMFFDHAQQAATGPLGELKEWSNPKSGAKGSVRAVRSYTRDDNSCRELRGQNYARGRTESFRLAICKGPDGEWRIAPFEPPPKPAATSPAPEQPPPKAPTADEAPR